jgi:hypothetical protein
MKWGLAAPEAVHIATVALGGFAFAGGFVVGHELALFDELQAGLATGFGFGRAFR